MGVLWPPAPSLLAAGCGRFPPKLLVRDDQLAVAALPGEGPAALAVLLIRPSSLLPALTRSHRHAPGRPGAGISGQTVGEAVDPSRW
ncbi:hypothetical protein ACFCV9_18740 [Streptomyces sp. NPDC056367]